MSAPRRPRGVAFFDIDTQRDFMTPRGALYVPGARMVSRHIRALVAHAAGRGIRLLSSVDAHAEDDPEFATFPPHCVAGTRGQAKIPGTVLADRGVVAAEARLSPAAMRSLLEHHQLVLEKQTYDVFDNPNTERILRAAEVTRCVVFGVATDYCVRAAVLGLLQRGYRATVVADAIRGVAPDSTRRALAAMRSAGARFQTTSQILG